MIIAAYWWLKWYVPRKWAVILAPSRSATTYRPAADLCGACAGFDDDCGLCHGSGWV